MASSIRLSGFRKKDGTELFCFEPHWWVVSELRRNVTFKWIESNETGSYSDSDADISIGEGRILHEQFRPRLIDLIAFNTSCAEHERSREGTDEYSSERLRDYDKYVSELQSHLTTLDSAVGEGAAEISHFHVCVFDWDSGL